MSGEEEDNFRRRKALEFIAHCKTEEDQARVALAQAVERTKRAREKYETLFHECEARAVARRKSGQIITNTGYPTA